MNETTKAYEDFIRSKSVCFKPEGIEIERNKLNPKLFEFQNDIVHRALKLGKSAVFAGCGLGKTFIQLEWAKWIYAETGKNVLIIAPLAVSTQTKREGARIAIDVNIANSSEDVVSGINITNYEKIHLFDEKVFGAVVLDESSILKQYTGKTKRKLIEMFYDTPFKLCCTATPAPNDLMELLNHAEFLNIMKSNEALSIWFIADQRNSGHYILKGHASESFWEWISSWSCVLDKPSDMGYSDDGYCLPPLYEIDEIVNVDIQRNRSNSHLFRKPDLSATGFFREKRMTINDRVKRCAEIANGMEGQSVIWCCMNEESSELAKQIDRSVEIKGSDSTTKKEKAAIDFIDGKIKVLISKPSIFGFGLNFQNCSTCLFCGLDYSFEGYYQAVRRFYRFGQTMPVNVYRIIGETEFNILKTIREKEKTRNVMNKSVACFMKNVNGIHVGQRFASVDFSKINKYNIPQWINSEI